MTRTADPGSEGRLTLLLIALVVLPWLSSFGGEFVFDDDRLIRHNELIRSLTPFEGFLATKRPVVEFSLALNQAISGLETWSYHLVNILLHLGCVLLLRAWARGMLERLPGLPSWLPGPGALSFALALVWGVHPVQTETVTYVVQRAESMSALGYLGALWCWLRAREAERSWAWFLGAGLFAWFGMMSKSVILTLPVTILLMDYMIRPQGRIFDLKRTCLGWAFVLSSLLHPFLSGLVKGATRGVHGGKAAVGFTLQDFGPFDYLLSQSWALWGYLRLIVLPVGLCLDHGREVTTSIGAAILPGLGVVTLLGLTFLGLHRRRPAAMAAAFFFVVLAPTSSIVPIRDIFVEHRIYLAMAGPLAILLALGCRLLRGEKARRVALALVWALFLVLTLLRNLDYRDERGMWEDVVRKAPGNPRGHYTLGVFDARDGRYEESIRQAREALRLDPDHTLALVLIASSEIRLGRFEAAEKTARRAIEIDDDLQIAYSNLGDALSRQGRFPDAVEAHKKAVKAKKKFPKPHVDLAEALLKVGRLEDAEASLAMGLERGAGRMPAAWQVKGIIARRRGRFDDAVAAYRRALEIAPKMTDARLNLAIALQALGRHDEARDEVRIVLTDDPDNIRGQIALGGLSTLLGDFEASAAAYERARELLRRRVPGRPFPAARDLERARARLAALTQHDDVLRSGGAGLDPRQLALHAEIALGRSELEAALTLGRKALALDPDLVGDLERAFGYRIARAAAELGQGGENPEALGVALDLLETDLGRRELQITRAGLEAEAARAALQTWRADRVLASLWQVESGGDQAGRRAAMAERIERALADH